MDFFTWSHSFKGRGCCCPYPPPPFKKPYTFPENCGTIHFIRDFSGHTVIQTDSYSVILHYRIVEIEHNDTLKSNKYMLKLQYSSCH